MKLNSLKKYSPLVLRIGIAVVFLWFGFSQLKNPSSWTGMVPSYVQFINPILLIIINGIFEIILAALLLLGLFTRIAALLLTVHLFHITTIVGYGAIGARDLALTIATLSIFLVGKDEFCLDNLLKK